MYLNETCTECTRLHQRRLVPTDTPTELREAYFAEIDHILRIVCQMHGLDHRKAIHAPYILIDKLYSAQDAAFQAAVDRQKYVKKITFEEVGESDASDDA